MEQRAFREDLFYRLSVITIVMPPLRERCDDRLLAEHFRDRFARKLGRPVQRISRAAAVAITAHGWPGNVRELQNALERAVILSVNDEVGVEDLPAEVRGTTADRVAPNPTPGQAPDVPAAREVRRLAGIPDERERLLAALDAAGGHRERAAGLLGMSRTSLWRRMRRHDLLRDAPDS